MTNAFVYKDATSINNAIEQLATRVKRTLTVPRITFREMLGLIAPQDHIEPLMAVRKIADISRYNSDETPWMVIANSRNLNVEVSFVVSGSDESPVMPKSSTLAYGYGSNLDLITTLRGCAREFADVAIDWGHVGTVFRYLNVNCKTPQQVRYIWPSILPILAMAGLYDIRDNISAHVLPRNLPVLPLEVRKLCRSTAATVSMATLLPPLESEPTEVKDVAINFRADSEAREVCEGVFTTPIN